VLAVLGTTLAQSAEPLPIALRGDVVTAQVCPPAKDGLGAVIEVRLHFKNVSQDSVILPRVWSWTRAVIADGGTGKPIVESLAGRDTRDYSDTQIQLWASAPPSPPAFQVVPAGGSYDRSDTIFFPDAPPGFGTAGKQYSLKVQFRPWGRFRAGRVRYLREKWKSFGSPFARPMTTEPVVFQIGAPACHHGFGPDSTP